MLGTWETWKYTNEKGTCMLFDVFHVTSSRNISVSLSVRIVGGNVIVRGMHGLM